MGKYSIVNFKSILFFFIFLSNVSFANENKIEIIDVIGTQRIDIETVISYSKIEIGDIYSEEIGNEIQKIYLILTYFQILKFHLKIIYFQNVKENPTINLVKFSGNSKLKMKIF